MGIFQSKPENTIQPYHDCCGVNCYYCAHRHIIPPSNNEIKQINAQTRKQKDFSDEMRLKMKEMQTNIDNIKQIEICIDDFAKKYIRNICEIEPTKLLKLDKYQHLLLFTIPNGDKYYENPQTHFWNFDGNAYQLNETNTIMVTNFKMFDTLFYKIFSSSIIEKQININESCIIVNKRLHRHATIKKDWYDSYDKNKMNELKQQIEYIEKQLLEYENELSNDTFATIKLQQITKNKKLLEESYQKLKQFVDDEEQKNNPIAINALTNLLEILVINDNVVENDEFICSTDANKNSIMKKIIENAGISKLAWKLFGN